jgi:hypothetical protein
LLKFLSGLSLRTLLLLLVLIGGVSLTGCSGTQALSLLTGGGPNVAANTQVGKNNLQTIGTSTVSGDQKIVRPQARDIRQSQDSNKVQADRVETVVVNEVPPWVILLALLGWLLPTPRDMVLGFMNIFRKKK